MKLLYGIIITLFLGAGLCGSAHALSYETEILLKLLEKKGIVTEEEADALREDMEAMATQSEAKEPAKTVPKSKLKEPKKPGGVKGIRKRYEVLDKIRDGIHFSGTVEVEAGYEKSEPAQGDSENSSDIVLATAELGVDAAITDRVKAHVLFSYEDDEDVVIDEAYIAINSDAVCEPDEACKAPWYAGAGKLYVPFGSFESHFLSDPLTLELGETRETAALAGVWNDWVNVAAGVFNGDINETGKDDHIAKFFAAGFFSLPEETVSAFELRAGVSYISDISDSNGLTDFMSEEFTTESEVTDEEPEVIPFDDEVQAYVQGFSAFISATFAEKFTVEAEYMGALDAYKENPNFKPQSWNFEFAFTPIEVLELAIRYGGSDKTLNFLPDTQYGGCIRYSLFENTSLALEYMYGEFENDDKEHSVTAQLAVEY